ncbi:D-tyrosyl-tRNA(Tyr) deacylase [Atopobacter sp. AH10]|uniref:D-aminoacyl-tRNA deacylase n=1 Tax=Atopobacter sp. AH10 TaxID=2315861 RepID=UPI000EF1838B|nr:D-aminoacyl-tRNA deacylase [Atopobacter sp. AH10]RLK62514.1 D-tyrosyl-tRNA(Tyr) deacylase [Atopobacter sp. AH10]
MKVVLQRVSSAKVTSDGDLLGQIGRGFLLLVGIAESDGEEDIDYCAKKIAKVRLFEDSEGKTNLDLQAIQGEILSVSQFSLLASTKKGNRPSFLGAGDPEHAKSLYLQFNKKLEEAGYKVETGRFGADMQVELVNDGPMTILYDSKNRQ